MRAPPINYGRKQFDTAQFSTEGCPRWAQRRKAESWYVDTDGRPRWKLLQHKHWWATAPCWDLVGPGFDTDGRCFLPNADVDLPVAQAMAEHEINLWKLRVLAVETG